MVKLSPPRRGISTVQNQDVVLVCTLCGSTSETRSQGIKSGGLQLLEKLQSLRRDETDIAVREVRCMAVCKRSCAIALMGQGKRTYLFGDLPVESESLAETATTVLNYARQYHAHPQGSVPYSNCPNLMRSGMLGVLPALPQ
jgi:predicted metal-binding protein